MLALADAVLAAEDPDNFVVVLAEYVSAFDEWVASLPVKKGAAPLSEQAEAEARLVIERHSAIVEAAERLKVKTNQDLRSLKQRGKRILAYADQLPKRISVHAHRKG